MSRIHVLTLTDVLVGGGAERLAVEIALGLDPARFERTLCVSRWEAVDQADPAVRGTLAELETAGVRVIGLRRSSKGALWQWRPLLAFLRRRRVDVLHAHKFGANISGVGLGRLAGVPVVVAHEHTWSYEGQPLRRLADRHVIARFADAFVAVSETDRRRMIEIERIPPDDITLVPNGIRPVPPSGADVRAELHIAPDAPVLVTVGMLRPQKRFDVLLRAVAEVRRRHPQVCVLIAGGEVPTTYPEEPARLRALAHELGLDDAVRFLGRRPDVPDLLATADVAVVSSDFEGSPLSVMEYMAAGLPVVATRVGGLPSLVDDGVHGRLVEPGDAAALGAAIGDVLDDPARARRMGQAGRERRQAEFDLDATIARLAALYDRLLDDRR